jgi:ABC-type transport system substrate-binding protein
VALLVPFFVSAAEKQPVAAPKELLPSASPRATKQPKHLLPKELHLMLPPHVYHMDPAMSMDAYAPFLLGNVYEGLLEYHYLERPLQPVPNLAAAMPTVSPDGCIYTITLQKGVFFHDDPCFPNGKGREVVAEDVVYSFKRLANQSLRLVHFVRLWRLIEGFDRFHRDFGLRFKDYNTPLPGVKAIDRYTVQFTLTKPFALFPNYLAMPFTSVVAKEAVDCYGENFKYHPVGTGPFVLPCLDPDARQLVFTKNNRFRDKFFPNTSSNNLKHFLASAGKKLPFLDKLVYHRPAHERSSEHLFYKNVVGILESDYLSEKERVEFSKMFTDADSLAWLEANGITPLQCAMHGFSFVAFNAFKYPLCLQKVRQAMSLAFDRITFNKRFMGNLGIISHSYIPINFAGHNAQLCNPYISYDLARAKQLLAEAGFPNGRRFPKLTLDIQYGEKVHAAAMFFADCMKRIGICIEVKQHDFPELLLHTHRGGHTLTLLGWRADFPDFASMFELIRLPRVGGGIRLMADPFDALYDKAMGTVDDGERAKIFAQLDEQAAELVPCLLLPTTHNYAFVHQWVKNYVMNPFLYGKTQYLDVLPHERKLLFHETVYIPPCVARPKPFRHQLPSLVEMCKALEERRALEERKAQKERAGKP